MIVQIDLHHVASGPFFFASGKRKPDAYRFERVKAEAHIHRLVIEDATGEKAVDVLKDLGLRLQQVDIPVHIRIIVEDSDRDGAEELAEAKAAAASFAETIDGLTGELETLRAKKAEAPKAETGGTKITDAQIEMLLEHDEMLALLAPHVAKEEDTPLDVLRRVLKSLPKKPPK